MTRLTEQAADIIVASPAVHLSTLMNTGGAPKTEPVWADVEDGKVLIATDARTIKVANVEADARVALSVTAVNNPYEQVLIRGRVIQIRDNENLDVLDRLSRRRLGTPFPRRRWSHRVVLVIQPHLVRHYRSSLGDLVNRSDA